MFFSFHFARSINFFHLMHWLRTVPRNYFPLIFNVQRCLMGMDLIHPTGAMRLSSAIWLSAYDYQHNERWKLMRGTDLTRFQSTALVIIGENILLGIEDTHVIRWYREIIATNLLQFNDHGSPILLLDGGLMKSRKISFHIATKIIRIIKKLFKARRINCHCL